MQAVQQGTHRASIPEIADRVVRIYDVLKILSVSRSTLYRLFEAGELRPFRIGARSSGVLQSDIQAFIARRSTAKGA